MLRSPWLGILAIAIAGITGYVLSDKAPSERALEAVTITIRPTRDTGAAWDFGGGLPDPRVRVEHAGATIATCEGKDVLQITCKVGAKVAGAVRVIVVDVDSSDDDLIGEAALDSTSDGALQAVTSVSSGGQAGAWQRLRALWIALAIGFAIAGALAVYRHRHA